MRETKNQLRKEILAYTLADERQRVAVMLAKMQQTAAQQKDIEALAVKWVREIRAETKPGLMESLLTEYGLSTQEGVAMMCLAESYLRVPDVDTLDELIADKIGTQDFVRHLGHSSSFMVNASTWGLMLTGSLLTQKDEQNLFTTVQSTIRRLGEPVIRVVVRKMMKLIGGEFVLGQTIKEALETAQKNEKNGFRHSYDMLGEAALTQADADRYYLSYADAITEISNHAKAAHPKDNPGISVKLSALYPRYETLQHAKVMLSLFPAIRSLCLMAKKANIGLNIDAEEAERLDISLDIIEALVKEPSLQGWSGLGIVVQAYGHRSGKVIDWLYALAKENDAQLMVRLVKGAYWDREIKRHQELGLAGYPVFTRKANTDVSYLYCAEKLLDYRDRIYPQFATHNAHTVAAIQILAANEKSPITSFEFQRLHGMGESLHQIVHNQSGIACRIYAPVGVHQDLLAYLVRRLLENGANASFVNQLLDENVDPRVLVENPLRLAQKWLDTGAQLGVKLPTALFQPERKNSKGWDWLSPNEVNELADGLAIYADTTWHAAPIIAGASAVQQVKSDNSQSGVEAVEVINPATGQSIGTVVEAQEVGFIEAIRQAKETAQGEDENESAVTQQAPPIWQHMNGQQRLEILNLAADLYESNATELMALLIREAGKTLQDAIAEIREAVDFLRYYAAQAEMLSEIRESLGVVGCISPWNFPLAIFTGQLSAALAMGNSVIVKPAEATPLIAFKAVQLLHQAGVPVAACQYLPGQGAVIGAAMSRHPDIAGMVFTGSTATAKKIDQNLARYLPPNVPFVAETGGLNAMIVDSSALPEQVVVDVIASAFQSAGQRCSALRMLYVQVDVADRLIEMLCGAMDALSVGNTWDLQTDIGPIIDASAQQKIAAYCEQNAAAIIKQLAVPSAQSDQGYFIGPTLLKVSGITDLKQEIFGPILHISTFEAKHLPQVLADINQTGYGLTFGLHTRIDSRVSDITSKLEVGNFYVNRNQIGAIVGSQPFGGEGLSGTGPKAGGPNYLYRLSRGINDFDIGRQKAIEKVSESPEITLQALQNDVDQLAILKAEVGEQAPLGDALAERYSPMTSVMRSRLQSSRQLPGPTGEENQYTLHPRGVFLVVTDDPEIAFSQTLQALFAGNSVIFFESAAPMQPAIRSWLEQHKRVKIVKAKCTAELVEKIDNIAGVVNAISTTAPSTDEAEEVQQYRQALAQRAGAILPLITESFAPYRYVQERHLCVNTTAAGGNVQLLAESS